MDKVCFIGCGGHARSVADVLINNNPDVLLSFYDANAKDGERIFSEWGGYCVYRLETIDDINENIPIFIAIGDNQKRKEIAQKYCHERAKFNIISGNAIKSKFTKMGYGNFVGHMGYIGPGAVIGNYNIINTASIIEHEVCVGNFTHISVNATVCGRCKIGSNVFLGAGSTVIDKVSVCDDVLIGANSVVVDSIIVPGVYVGNPAKMIKPYN